MSHAIRVAIVAVLLISGGVTWAQPRPALRPATGPADGPRDPRREGTLKVGDKAPDFGLKTLDGEREVKLSGFIGKRPVVLVFASYT